jgi:hypothetical protein
MSNYFKLFRTTSGLFSDNDTTFNRPTICSNLTSPYKPKTPNTLNQPNNQRKKFHPVWLGLHRDKIEPVSRSFHITFYEYDNSIIEICLSCIALPGIRFF